MYWLLRLSPPTEADSLVVHGVPTASKSLSLNFRNAKSFPFDIPCIEFQIEKNMEGNITDNFLAYSVRAPFLNTKGLSCLKSVSAEDVDYIDTKITDLRHNHEYQDYKIVNIKKAVHCVDFDKSELILRENGNIKFIDKLVLNERTLVDNKILICRIHEFLPLIVAHDSIKNEMEQSGVTGLSFMRPEKLSL